MQAACQLFHVHDKQEHTFGRIDNFDKKRHFAAARSVSRHWMTKKRQ